MTMQAVDRSNAPQGVHPWCVRVARGDDAEPVAQVHVASWQHAYRDVLPADYLANLSVDRRRTLWADAIVRGEPTLLVCEAADGISGFAAVGRCRDKDSTPAAVEIWAIYVAPTHWGSGAGRALWQASHTLAAERGAARLSLWVFENNPRARRFYESMGMRAETGPVQTFVLAGTTLSELRYVVPVGAHGSSSSTSG